MFVKPWTSKVRHFGTTTTSPVEGSNSTVKTFLSTSRNDLFAVVNATSRYQQMQITEINADLVRQ